MSRRLLPLLAVLFCSASVSAASQYPPSQGWVTDGAGVLDSAAQQKISDDLAQFESRTSNEVAVLITPSLNGDSIDQYANGVFSQWKLGKKGKDNGVLILIAVNDHKARIEVGYGLESVLPDGVCGDIIRTQMVPLFKDERYADGLEAGIQAIRAQLGDAPVSSETPLSRSPFRLNRGAMALLFGAFYFLPFTLIAFLFGLGILGPRFPSFFWVPLPLGLLFDVLRWKTQSRMGVRSGRYYGGWGGYGGGFGGFGGGGGFGGFGGGMGGGGGASGGW